MSRNRTIVVPLVALAALLAAAPFLPRGIHDEGAISPSAQPAYAPRTATAAGPTTVTAAMRREIDAVVAAGRVRLPRPVTAAARARAVRSVVRCAELEGQRYCLGVGWTTESPRAVRTGMIRALERPRTTAGTGDADARTVLSRLMAGTPAARAARDRAELTSAARSVAKVWLLRHELQGVPLPTGFLDRHPEARVAVAAGTRPKATTYPKHKWILNPKHTAAQTRTYWCGPTAAQMIVWGWRDKHRSQKHWAERLGTTTAGTAISAMVRVVNNNTGWDNQWHAGKYIVLDIKGWSYNQWWKLIKKHISAYTAPVVLHPILLKKYYPYLDDDASGHFQVGRGYKTLDKKPDLIGYFEPWNQQRFDPSEPYIARSQWRVATRSYRANEAHFQHNIGV
ncbi:C39 family peptidase [Nocardioides cheoyonin]|uniref:C39 family peptidase n=1 Tax=Nocardioides cheoyonin TaxID=3156615 RepID=UPI0032B60140